MGSTLWRIAFCHGYAKPSSRGYGASSFHQPYYRLKAIEGGNEADAAVPAVGIDLGTTSSVVAIVKNGQPIVLSDEDGRASFPSVVCFPTKGKHTYS